MMTRWRVSSALSALGLSFSLGGCPYIGPDVEPIHEEMFWKDARIDASPAHDPGVEDIRITPGDQTILMTNDGNTHGKRSSAHASHHALYMALPRDLVEGQTYEVTRDAGTLHLHAFAGYNFWYLDAKQPAHATVHIRTVRAKTVVADVQAEFTEVCASRNTPEEQRARRPTMKTETIEFRRESVRDPS